MSEDDPQPTAEDLEHDKLAQLSARFWAAMAAREAGRIDAAEDALRAILREEPRLPEPRLELARTLLDTERLEEAEDHAREAIIHLEAGGAWTDDLDDNVVLSIAHATLAEALRQRAESDEVVFGDPAVFKALVEESKDHFTKAAELDPSDATASYYAFFMGPPSGTGAPTT